MTASSSLTVFEVTGGGRHPPLPLPRELASLTLSLLPPDLVGHKLLLLLLVLLAGRALSVVGLCTMGEGRDPPPTAAAGDGEDEGFSDKSCGADPTPVLDGGLRPTSFPLGELSLLSRGREPATPRPLPFSKPASSSSRLRLRGRSIFLLLFLESWVAPFFSAY